MWVVVSLSHVVSTQYKAKPRKLVSGSSEITVSLLVFSLFQNQGTICVSIAQEGVEAGISQVTWPGSWYKHWHLAFFSLFAGC